VTVTSYAALDLVPEAVVVLDQHDVVAHVNDRARALLGLDDGALGQPLDKVVELRDDLGEPYRGWIPRRGVADRLGEQIARVALPDGRERPVAVAGRYVDGGVVLTFRSAGRRQRIDAVRSDLVATVSHEIRSPLTSVKGFTSTLLRKWDKFSDAQKHVMLEAVNHDADRVTRLLGELLDVSRIDAGRVQLHRELVDVGAVVTGLIERYRHRDEGVGRDLTVTVADGLSRVYADPDKLLQMVSNVVENALLYAPDSEVRIAVTPSRDAGVVITVADDGPGVAWDQTRRIFEKFGRGRDQRRAGTGLGLFITRGLVHAHGGRVWCESPPGSGATFHIELGPD
jgi:signal transduction histidine kinase